LGTVFRLEATGELTTLYNFADEDGTSQPTVLVQGSTGTIFGVTRGQFSTVFRLNPGGGITPLHRFDELDEGTAATALIVGADGNLYGAMQNDGPGGHGTVYRLDTSGALTTLHAFSGADGSGPWDLIQGSDGDFYGVTVDGTIFKIDAAGTFTVLHRLPAANEPIVLLQGSDGSFYVHTESSIFRFVPGGTPTTLHTFTGEDGRSIGALVQASDGKLYGTKLLGGTALGEGGTIFALDLDGTFAVLHHFGRNPGPARPLAHVTQGSDGRLYGTTSAGGLSDFGTVFTIEPSGAGTVLHGFSGSDGLGPGAGLVQATDGRFYSTTSGRFGFFGEWTLFAIDATGTLTTRHRFPPPPTPQNPTSMGSRPNGLIQATDGRLYGTTDAAVFSLPLSGTGPVQGANGGGDSDAALVEASDGTLYGTTRTGGAQRLGTIFSVPAGSVSGTTRHTFSGADGSLLRGRLIEGVDGSLYGTTSDGGVFGFGTVFRFDPAGTLTTLHHFTGTGGANPYAGLLLATDGRFYGTTRMGGLFDYGTIFTIDATGTLTTLHSFAATDGAFPVADLIQASDGNLYGTTESGGPVGGGVMFRVRLGTLPPPTDEFFEIVSRNSGKCLDVFGASTDAGASAIQWVCHGGPNQQWRLEPAGGGAFRIIARHSGQALDVFGALLDDVTPIIQWPAHGGDNQVWTLEPASDHYVRIVARHSGKAMDVEFASAADGARVIQYTPHGGANQQWLLRAVRSTAAPVTTVSEQ
jgi:uncharacterized repeat protein (TIGR03803 family)